MLRKGLTYLRIDIFAVKTCRKIRNTKLGIRIFYQLCFKLMQIEIYIQYKLKI
jgi:hypothetical protein